MAILSSSPGTSCYASCVDRSSPLIVAAGGPGTQSRQQLHGAHARSDERGACVSLGADAAAATHCMQLQPCVVCQATTQQHAACPAAAAPLTGQRVATNLSPRCFAAACRCVDTPTCTAGGHARLVQAILEAAVLSQGLARAKERCINHTTSKGHSALMVACINGWACPVWVGAWRAQHSIAGGRAGLVCLRGAGLNTAH